MLKKIVNPLMISAVVLMPLLSGCSSDAKKDEAKTTSVKPIVKKVADVKPVVKKVADVKPTPAKVVAEHEYNIKPVKVADGVYCMFGELDMPKASNAGFMSNSCYIQTSDSWVVWDTGATYKFAKAVYTQMQKIADLPVKTIIFSHEHDDHWLGAGFYKEKFNSTLIGTKIINERYIPGHEAETRMFKILNPIDLEGTKITPMDKSYNEGHKFDIGGVKMEYISLGQAHSEDDFLLYLPEKKVILTADVVMNGRITSNRNGTVMGQLAALDVVKSKDWNVLVPGHGLNTSKTAMDESVLYFTQMKEQILAALENDVDATDINEVVTLPDFKDKGLYKVLNSNNVSRSYSELEMLE
jgi:glyoxylase-like metal-dependent hydrolase (beta-lactamase superfamily II)/outer membrane murein-binding lipoprotein Lpp